MKRLVAVLIGSFMVLSTVACAVSDIPTLGSVTDQKQEEVVEFVGGQQGELVTISVVSTFAGKDGNAQNYLDSVAEWELATGNKVNDSSATSDEVFRKRVITDFELGVEPDVLFYFNGNDSDAFVSANKVVSIDEIRREYPEYAANMKEDMILPAPSDGLKYAIPVNGYWEGLFVNKKVLEEVGIEVPGSDYTWEQFLIDCEAIKKVGYTPIAASLVKEPHYWFEFAIYNQLSPENHCILPTSIEDEQGVAWIEGLSEIKNLYERGYFANNALSASSDEVFNMFVDGKAAFLIDGSWKLGSIEKATDYVEDFTVTYVPGKGERKATDIIGGLSSGWYITRKAWDDPEKRAAVVDFVSYMTSDAVVAKFGTIAVTALKNSVVVEGEELSSLSKDAIIMTAGATGITGAVQDLVPNPEVCRAPIFNEMANIVLGYVDIANTVQEVLDLIEAQKSATE
ncbi:MAG: ABC transporter substrate-binding protein [Eubacteriales bacterium]